VPAHRRILNSFLSSNGELLIESQKRSFFNYFFERIIMNKDQVKGAVKNMAGQVQQKTGEMVGSKEQQVKGLNKQVSGRAQEAFGDAKEIVKHSREAASASLHKV
jgi:uncharacterized protein YjbJ (UPF0337 family)